MKYLIRDLVSGHFYGPGGEWVESIDEAIDVGSVEQALESMRGRELANLELLAASDDRKAWVGHHMPKLAATHSGLNA